MLTDHQKHQIEATATRQIRQDLEARRNHFTAQHDEHINRLTDRFQNHILNETWLEKSPSEKLDALSELAWEAENDLDLSHALDR